MGDYDFLSSRLSEVPNVLNVFSKLNTGGRYGFLFEIMKSLILKFGDE